MLNFACSVVISKRPFLRRLIDLQFGLTQSYHHKRLNKEARRPNFLEFIFFLNISIVGLCFYQKNGEILTHYRCTRMQVTLFFVVIKETNTLVVYDI